MLYNALFLPFISYCVCVWGNTYPTHLQKIIVLQKRMIRILSNSASREHTSPLFRGLGLIKFTDMISLSHLNVLHGYLYSKFPTPISAKFQLFRNPRNTRLNNHFHEPFARTNAASHSIFFAAPRTWNALVSSRIPNIEDVPRNKKFFKLVIKKIFLDQY